MMGLCSVCHGNGVVAQGTKNERECPYCYGTGFVDYNEDEDEDEYEDD